ncbi:hypothetical protein C3B51_07090 [Pseudoalteromonas rubra]|uniref:Aldehyde-activating protein n=1 Tax=Pseudoalteromonas rubra TaxID=43658 RepID=A0A4Q7EI50_9GAMM|nr:hypothetical protein [Pseudoalteromonas rubra]RZM83381.1 hypothetical protein C3B51_07090 [Pseudoalteromonas rubra]
MELGQCECGAFIFQVGDSMYDISTGICRRCGEISDRQYLINRNDFRWLQKGQISTWKYRSFCAQCGTDLPQEQANNVIEVPAHMLKKDTSEEEIIALHKRFAERIKKR